MQGSAGAVPCAREERLTIAGAKSVGDVYNQLASDGDELAASYFAKATLVRGAYAYTIQTHHSAYDTQHEGANTNTGVHTIAGPTVAVPWFVATDETVEARAERCIGFLGVYAGFGVARTSTNYDYPLGYKHLFGFGIGLERYADPRKPFDAFGALYYYPAATGQYGGTQLAYTIVTFDGGVRARIGSRTGAFLGLYQEMRSLHPGSRAGQTVRVAPYFGFDLTL